MSGGLDISITGGAQLVTLRYHEEDGNEAEMTYVPLVICHVEHVKHGPIFDVWRFDCCGYEHAEPRTIPGASELPQRHCPNCGAKVVDE